MDTNKNTVFISYSHKDKEIADSIVSFFESNNLNCWYAPRDIQPSEEWAEAIINAIKRSKIMILVFTDYSNVSKQVSREVETAINNEVIIIPFKLTNSNPEGSMEYYLATLHWMDAMGKPMDRSITELFDLTRSILDDKTFASNKQEDSRLQKKSIYLYVGIFALLLVGLLLLINHFKEQDKNTIETEEIPEFSLYDVRERDIINALSPVGTFAIKGDEDGDDVFYLGYYAGLYKSKYSDFLDYDNDEKLLFNTNVVCLAYADGLIFYSDFDYLHSYNPKTGEDLNLGCFNSDYYLGAGKWVIFVDRTDGTLKRVSSDGKYIETFEGITLNPDAPIYTVYQDRIYYLEKDVLKVYDSDGKIYEVKYTSFLDESQKEAVIRARHFFIFGDLMFYIDKYDDGIYTYDLTNGERSLFAEPTKGLVPLCLSVWSLKGVCVLEADENGIIDCYLVVENKEEDKTSFYTVEKIVDENHEGNILYVNMIDEYIYYTREFVSEEGEIVYDYVCIPYWEIANN